MFRNVNIEKEFCTAAPIKGSFGQVKVKCDFLFHVHDTINYKFGCNSNLICYKLFEVHQLKSSLKKE